MKKNQTAEPTSDEMRSHYDFDYGKSRPNRFAASKVDRVRPVDIEHREREAYEQTPEDPQEFAAWDGVAAWPEE